MRMSRNKPLPDILSCDSCGIKPETLEKDRPAGRLRDLYRIACVCGRVSPQWSVSAPAAIRFWNRIMAEDTERE
jgi:hypothetical protein